MTDNDLLIVSIAGFLIAIAGWLAAKYTAWRRKKQLTERAAHPAE
jgi:hypothetical protein